MISKKVDIIVPVYNKSKYLNSLLNSFQYLPKEYFNIIIVDDGSTDNSVLIVKKYLITNKNENIFLREKENGGVSSARNLGLSIAKSEYIWFFDPDDKIHDDFLNNFGMVNDLNEDIIVFNFVIENVKFKKISTNTHKIYGVMPKKEFMIQYDSLLSDNKNMNLIWNKFYKRKFIEDIKFNENLKLGEDKVFNYDIFSKGGNVLVMNHFLYHYFFYESDTLSTSLNTRKVQDLYLSSRYCLDILGHTRKNDKLHIIEQLKLRTMIGDTSLFKFYKSEHSKLNLKIFPLISLQEFILFLLITFRVNVVFYKIYSIFKYIR